MLGPQPGIEGCDGKYEWQPVLWMSHWTKEYNKREGELDFRPHRVQNVPCLTPCLNKGTAQQLGFRPMCRGRRQPKPS